MMKTAANLGLALLLIFLAFHSCADGGPTMKEPDWAALRRAMVRDQIEARGVKDRLVLQAMAEVPRHLFVPEGLRARAYDDGALPIGLDQTISQPYIVALMTELAGVKPGDKVLEIGTGSGYQAAVLARMGAEVYSIEIIPELAQRARKTLEGAGFKAQVRAGDGWFGWPEAAPFKAVLVTASTPQVPPRLASQLAPGGRLVLPQEEGRFEQSLAVYEKKPDGEMVRRDVIPVVFVPLTGQARKTPTP